MILNILNKVLSLLFGIGCSCYYFYCHQFWTCENILKGIGAGIIFFMFAWLCIFLLIWLFFLGVALTINTKEEYSRVSKIYYGIFNFWYSYICSLTGMKIKVTGLEKMPSGTRFLTVCNHRSNFDNMVQSAVLKHEKIAFISKIENFKIPFACQYMTRALYLPIDRGHPKKALETITKAIGYINNDIISVGVFPEGSRSKNCELKRFKAGCLRVAEKTGCPIVVCTIQGTEKVHKNFLWKKTVVNFDILRVYSTEEVKASSTVKLADEIRELMLEKLGK